MTRRLVSEAAESVGGPAGVKYELYEAEGTNPEVYIDGMHGVMLVGSIIKINCFTRGGFPAAKAGEVEQRDVACRLVMGLDTFLNVMDWLKVVDKDIREKVTPISIQPTR
jgi:hypothetical protein